jgi:hypothetical protein
VIFLSFSDTKISGGIIMKKLTLAVMCVLLFISVGYLLAQTQVKQQTRVTTAKTAQIEPVDLLKRIQELENEMEELKKVIQLNRSGVKIATPGRITLQTSVLELKAATTTFDTINAKIDFGPLILEGKSPSGPVFVPFPPKIPVVLTK